MFNQYSPFINYRMAPSRFSFSNILNNAQKVLNIANQALPVVKEVRPIIKNARTFINVAKGFSKVNSDTNVNKEYNKTPTANNNSNNVGPSFFI